MGQTSKNPSFDKITPTQCLKMGMMRDYTGMYAVQISSIQSKRAIA